jgi:predicted AAA+ superfamily ATPase
MSPEEARKIILDQEEEESKQIFEKKIIRREILPQINSSLVAPNAFLITGVRRCGKSTLAIQVAEQHSYARVNFDDERLSGLIPRDLNNILEAVYTLHGDVDVLVLDEIQVVKGWEMFVARLRDTKKVLVTGSNSSLMSREFGTRLTGRHLDFTLFPFSFREFISYKGFVFEESTKGIAKAKKYLEEYMSIGGFPEVLLFGTQVLKSIMNDIILKDIVLRYGIRNE